MRQRRALRSYDQLGLFHSPLTAPRWTDLPSEVRQQTTVLLARLLRLYRRGLRLHEPVQEVRDE